MLRIIDITLALWRGLGLILTHRIFWACILAWFFASLIKMILFFISYKKIDFTLLMQTGRMPSSHSAFVTCLATVIGLEVGWESPIFMLALGFAVLTMNDAQGVRRSAGQQAAILNKIMEDIYENKPFKPERLKEFLGHTPVQVFAGAIVGIICGAGFYF